MVVVPLSPRPLLPRSLWRRAIGFFYPPLLAVSLLVFVPILLDGWAAEHRWLAYKKEAALRGVPMTLSEPSHVSLPATENFPATGGLFALGPASAVGAQAAENPQQRWADHLEWLPLYAFPNLLEGKRADFVKAAEIASTQRQTSSESTHSRPTPASAEEFLLACEEEFGTEWLHVLEAEAKPKAQFETTRSLPSPEQRFPGLFLRKITQIHTLRATALLQLGRHEEAAHEMLAAFRLGRAFREWCDPSLVATMFCAQLDYVVLGPLWQGLVDRTWSDAELDALDRELSQAKPAESWKDAIDGERRFVNAVLDDLADTPIFWRCAKARPILVEGFIVMHLNENAVDRLGSTSLVALSALTDVVRASQLAANENLDALGMQVDQTGQWHPEFRLPHQIDEMAPLDHLRCLLDVETPKYTPSPEHVVETEARIRQARLAIALERYHRAHQMFPENLTDLIPAFLAEIPLDPFDGQAMRYARDSNQPYRLWSVGENRRDDGGVVADHGRPAGKDFDLVWWGSPQALD